MMTRWWLKGLAPGRAAPALAALILAALVALAPPASALGDFSSWNNVATAASQNKLDDVQTFLLKHSDPDAVDDQGRPALIWAVNYNNVAMIKLLLDHGAAADSRDSFGDTALHWAAQRGSTEAITLLINGKATIDALNKQGATPLMMAAGNGKSAAVRLLLAHGANPKLEDYTGRDARGWAAGKPAVLQILAQAH